MRIFAGIPLMLGLIACGGGGGGAVGAGATTSAPPPAPPPAGPGSTGVELLNAPATQQFAVTGSGGQLDIRYDAGSGLYQVNVNDSGWKTLSDDPQSSPSAGAPNVSFVFTSTSGGRAFFMIRAHHDYPGALRYQYSNLAVWGNTGDASSPSGFTAFGVPTAVANVPRAGSGTYSGMIEGKSSVLVTMDGQTVNAGIEGAVDLRFDFAAGTLNGEIRPVHYVLDKSALPTLAFSNTVYAVGSQTFNGKFATSAPGLNVFSGQFTGPNAEELIGNFAFPFIYPVDGTVQQATGAMIAKR